MRKIRPIDIDCPVCPVLAGELCSRASRDSWMHPERHGRASRMETGPWDEKWDGPRRPPRRLFGRDI